MGGRVVIGVEPKNLIGKSIRDVSSRDWVPLLCERAMSAREAQVTASGAGWNGSEFGMNVVNAGLYSNRRHCLPESFAVCMDPILTRSHPLAQRPRVRFARLSRPRRIREALSLTSERWWPLFACNGAVGMAGKVMQVNDRQLCRQDGWISKATLLGS